MSTEKLTVNIDSTALGNAGCILKLMRVLVGEIEEGKPTGGYTNKLTPARMVYGIAGHKFLELMYKGERFPVAMKAALDLYNTIPKAEESRNTFFNDPKHLQTVLYNVWTEYVENESSFDILDIDGPTVECTFKIPYYEDDECKIYLCGTIDKIGKFRNGCYAIGDWKFTSSRPDDSYFVQYELSRQLYIYNLAIKLMKHVEPNSTIGRIGATQIGVFIDGIFLSNKPNDTKVIRSDVRQISQNDLDAFQLTLDSMCQRIAQAIKTGYLPKEGILNGACQGKWSNCMFWNVCKNSDTVGKALLKRDFRQKIYDPLHHNEM